jgi:putative pyruvate formate lyase activating enzyme
MLDDAGLVGLLERVQSRDHVKNHFIVQSIPAGMDEQRLAQLSISDAWMLHDHLHRLFLEKRVAQRVIIKNTTPNYLDVKVKLVREMLATCNFCERGCGVNRVVGMKGACGVGVEPRLSSAFLHQGEEHPLVPSGTIFFAGCNFTCAFCQNSDISTDPLNGTTLTPRSLARAATTLAMEGARNINYVGGDPTPNLHAIIESLQYQGLPVAQLWNSNNFNTMDAMKLLLDVMDIWLPDLKYGNDSCAKRLSGIDNYWRVLTRDLQFVHDAMVKPGHASLVIRHLVMPGHVDCCSIPAIEWIASNLPVAMVNIMGQYRPQHRVLSDHGEFNEISRRPSSDELGKVTSRADELGICWNPVS